MNRPGLSPAALRAALIGIVLAVAIVCVVAFCTSCTVVYMPGDNNRISGETGGHGGGVTVTRPADNDNDHPLQNLLKDPDTHH